MFNIFVAVYDFIEKRIEYLKANERERRILKLVPYTCQRCELLGICRDEFNGWKCKHGCYFINSQEERRR